MLVFLRRFSRFVRWAWFAAKAEEGFVTLSRAMDGDNPVAMADAIGDLDESARKADMEWQSLSGNDDGSKARRAAEAMAVAAGFDGSKAGAGAAAAVTEGSRSQGMARMWARTAVAMAMDEPGLAKIFSREASESAAKAVEGFLSFAGESSKWGGSGMMDRQRMVSCLRGMGMRMAALSMSGGDDDLTEASSLLDVCRRFWMACVSAEGDLRDAGLRPVPVAARLAMVQMAMAAEEFGEARGDRSLTLMARDLMGRVTKGGLPSFGKSDEDAAFLPMRALEFARRAKLGRVGVGSE